MKKFEAELLAPQKVDAIMEYIIQILEDQKRVEADIDFNSCKIEGQVMKTLDIYVPVKNFERHLNLGITNDHSNVIFKEFLDRITSDLLPHETIEVTRFYSLKSNDECFEGINVINATGSEIKINMYGIDKNISDDYNKKYNEFANNIEDKNLKKI